MADSLAVMVSTGTEEAITTALNLLGAAASMEMETHLYLTGAAVAWVGPADPARRPAEATDEARERLAEQLREIKEDGKLTVYACSRAMAQLGVPPQELSPEVDTPAGFAYFLSLATEATVTINF